MKIVVYCQHVLGVGHLFRTIEICKAMAGHEVILALGGPRIEAELPAHVSIVQLPYLQMDPEFKELFGSDKAASLDQIRKKRKKTLLALIKKERPHIFLVELYPFGRKAFRYELDPVLEEIRSRPSLRCGVISSVRDILVEKEDQQRHEGRALEMLNRYFDAVVIHADPGVVTLDETFFRFSEINIPVVYTGYIAQKPPDGARGSIRKQLGIKEEEPLIVASAGGGSVGKPLLEAVIRAFSRLKIKTRAHLRVYTGPFISGNDFVALRRLKNSARNIHMEKFAADFLSLLAAADLSISMAGYNTTMNILTSGVPALVWPFAQNSEQRLRARRLADLGALKLIDDEDLVPGNLARLMRKTLASSGLKKIEIDLNGAAHTVRWLESWSVSCPQKML
jgi:predicted glycosyltransferase